MQQCVRPPGQSDRGSSPAFGTCLKALTRLASGKCFFCLRTPLLIFATALNIYNQQNMFSKSCKYAIRAVLYLAINTDDDTKLGVEELATELVFPKHFLGKILQQLAKSGMVSSAKGKNGGFYLSKQNKAANLLTVIESIDGKGIFTDCILGLDNCSNENPCPYHNSIQKVRSEFLMQLKGETIEASAKRINEQSLKLKDG